MKLSVFGLGYVGCVTAACLAEAGHEIYGVDVNADKVRMINDGKSPVGEPGVGDMLARARSAGRVHATTDPTEAVQASELSLLCVGTPSNANGSVDISALRAAARQIGETLGSVRRHHTIVSRSTAPPGTVRGVLIPELEAASGLTAHQDFDACMHPEFLREGSAVADFNDPPFVVVGEGSPHGGDAVASMYAGLNQPIERTTYEVAEILKYSCNAFHALKVAFANEIGTLCKSHGIDSHRVMELFVRDRKLNVSPAYLQPGFAFGGSCLPKDLRALLHNARQRDVEAPVLASILESNRLHLDRILQRVIAARVKRVGMLGLSFKSGTDDLRESPSVALIEALIGKGFDLRIYDSDVALARIFGGNKRFIEKEIPHIARLMSNDVREVIRESEFVVLSKKSQEFSDALAAVGDGKHVLDLVRIPVTAAPAYTYEGVCW